LNSFYITFFILKNKLFCLLEPYQFLGLV
jgi:hypothetical protein